MKRLSACFACAVAVVCAVALSANAEAITLEQPSAFANSPGGMTRDLLAESLEPPLLDQGDSGWTVTSPSARRDVSLSADYEVKSVGFGGHGAVFDPVFSPFDSETIVADCDMGGLYVTHDAGGNWDIKSLGGRVWDIQADPSTPGVFYAGGSGLWRSTDNGDNWELVWPDPQTVRFTPTKLNHSRTYYFSDDSFPDASVVEAVRVDPLDSLHLLTLASPAANYANDAKSDTSWRYLCESFDGGASFACIAQFKQAKVFKNVNFENTRVFVEHGSESATSRVIVVIPDGIYEVDRAAGDVKSALVCLHASDQTIGDVQQVIDGTGVHYVVLENVGDDAAASSKSRVVLYHTADFGDENAKVDLTSQLVESLPRHYNTQRDRLGDDYEITMHDIMGISAPSLDRMYLSYRTYDMTGGATGWQGINGLVTYDASRPDGERFSWTFGLRLWWSGEDRDARVTPDQNRIMARAHADASFTFFNVAFDPRNPSRIAFGCHTGLFFSPDIDADVGKSGDLDNVNVYPRYAVTVAPNPANPKNDTEGIMRSTGLEVTVVTHVVTDPFDPSHLLLCMDDAGMAHSYDGGDTWTRRYTLLPKGASDTCFDAVFDEGAEGVVYALWDAAGGSPHNPSKSFFGRKSCFARSSDGGTSWDITYSSGLPEDATGVKVAISYPRDASGAIVEGPRTVYVATMGYGFYVSHDSGKTFQPMNANIPTHKCAGRDVVWARDVQVTGDGRVFGITQYSSLGTPNKNGSTTYHSTQDAETFGNVWEWDAAAEGGSGAWVRLPLNTAGSAYGNGLQVRQPRAFYYDEESTTLYVAAVSCIGSYVTPTRWENFGGGLYTYRCDPSAPVGSGVAEAVDATSPLLGDARNLTGVTRDAAGRLWLATEDGEACYQADSGEWVKVCDDLLCLCHGFDVAPDGTLYFTTRGAGAFRITPASEGSVSAVLPDADLYAAVCDQLEEQGIACKRDDSTRTVSLAEREAAKMTRLDVSNRGVASLEGMGAFAHLTSLNISNNQVSNLDPLRGLESLSSLEARGNALSNDCLDAVGSMASLVELDLSLNLLSDDPENPAECVTSKLSQLGRLTSLNLSANQIRYVTGLGQLSELSRLDLYDNYVRDFAELASCENLAHLDLGENNETGGSPVPDASLKAFESLTKLVYLDFSENKTPDVVKHLDKCTGLEFLQLQDNGIDDLTGLEKLGALRQLILCSNAISDIQPLLGLGGLEELNLLNNRLFFTAEGSAQGDSLYGVVRSDGSLAWPHLAKLDLNRNFQPDWSTYQQPPELARLYALASSGADDALELGYNYRNVPDLDVSGRLHTDADGTRYTTYDDFGARCNGTYDDFIAIYNAHVFSERHWNCEVRATEGKTYHIFKSYETNVAIVQGNVDWRGANFVVHDEQIENKASRFGRLFYIQQTSSNDYRTITDPSWTIGTGTREVPQLAETIGPLNEKGYTRYLCTAFDSGKRQFIRSGQAGSTGAEQQDSFIIDSDCKVQGDIQWDFEKVTEMRIVPIPTERHFVRDATFVTQPVASKSETPYTRPGKQIYLHRNLYFGRCCNVEVSGIDHRIDSEELAGSYTGFFNYYSCADVEMSDCVVFPQKFNTPGRSAYDLALTSSVNVRLVRVGQHGDLDDATRWGVVGGNYLKDVVVDDCELNVFDAHSGIYNLTVRDSRIGRAGIAVVGQGTLAVERTTISSDRPVQLRADYGSFWNGDVRLTDFTWRPLGAYRGRMIAIDFAYTGADGDGDWWDYGYDRRFPDVYVENLEIDESLNSSYPDCDIVPNGLWAFYSRQDNVGKEPVDYWPVDIVVNGFAFTHAEGLSAVPHLHVTTTDLGTIRDAGGNYLVTDADIAGSPEDGEVGDEAGDGVMRRLLMGEHVRFAGPVTLRVRENATAANVLSVSRDGSTAVDGSEVSGVWEQTFVQSGFYEVRLTSRSAHLGWTGERVLSFEVKTDDRPADHVHEWGEWELVKAPTYDAPGLERRTCLLDASHAEEREVARLVRPGSETCEMLRLYNPNSGEHFFTANVDERDHLVSVGWRDEGRGWIAPASGDVPVYRLYNPNAGEHHYTIDSDERDHLASVGWSDEGIGWYSDDARAVPVYRVYNPNAFSCNHHFTTDVVERDWLVSLGWRNEGVGWYAIS